MSRYVAVAVPVPFLQALTYRVPEGMSQPVLGSRIRVPLGRRTVTGCVIGTKDIGRQRSDEEIRDVTECIDSEAFLPLAILKLALWVSDYYLCGPGDTIAAAMPPLTFSSGREATTFKIVDVFTVTSRGRDSLKDDSGTFLGRRQRDVLMRLVTAEHGIERSGFTRLGVSANTLKRLERRGFLSSSTRRLDRNPFIEVSSSLVAAGNTSEPLRLTQGQQEAMDFLAPLVRASEFHVALLRGVTGSGKTEVYLRLTEETFTSGKRVLILVPEIALTRTLALIFHRKFGERVAIQHSGLSEGERHDQWHRIRRGDIDVVVGTRSAVFAPLDGLGMIIVDEEHDSSFKQEESPRYHARDVAVVRGREEGALVVLGSATPSVETFFNVRSGRYRHVTMASRVYNRPLPKVRVVDMRKEAAAEGPDVVMSRALREALANVLDRNEQALLLLNRRGFAASVLCRQCGRTLDCPNCSLALTFHRATNRARCHYCNYSVPGPKVCGNCAGPYLDTVGFGTERVEIEVSNHFSSASIARLDRDSAKRRGGISSVLDRFARGDVDVLIGTQMIAKGHDFRNVTLVGVISGDVGLTQPDFRAAERTFQLLTQVAGRAGRGEKSGEAIVQSFYPSHYSIGYACHQDYEPFFDEEIRFRAEMQYPPTVSMINAVVRGRSLSAAMTDAEKVARILRGRSGFRVLGPAPAPITRLRGQYRAQLFLKGRSRRTMRTALLEALAERPELRRRMIIDVDPLSLL